MNKCLCLGVFVSSMLFGVTNAKADYVCEKVDISAAGLSASVQADTMKYEILCENVEGFDVRLKTLRARLAVLKSTDAEYAAVTTVVKTYSEERDATLKEAKALRLELPLEAIKK